MFGLHTGVRRSEITGLRWDGVDRIARTIRVTGTLQRVTGYGVLARMPKIKAIRRAIPLAPTTINLLYRIKGKQLALQVELGDLCENEAGYVFTSDLGKPPDSNRLSRGFAIFNPSWSSPLQVIVDVG